VTLLTTGHGIAASLNCARFYLCEAATLDDAVDLQSYRHVRNVGLAQRRGEVKANAKLFLDWIERINGALLNAALTPSPLRRILIPAQTHFQVWESDGEQ
jgi:hypothetical protein